MHIGVDLLGSDQPPNLIVDGAKEAARKLPSTDTLVLLGLAETIEEARSQLKGAVGAQFEYVTVADEIRTEDSPLLAVRRKRDSSIAVGMRLLRDGKLAALVSAGNTGAIIANSRITLPSLPGMDCPCLLASLPTVKGSVAVLDVGGNVDPRPHHLWQFAQMGAAYQRCSEGISVPKVGLLNIGTEPLKGTRGAREAYQLLTEESRHLATSRPGVLEFVGNIEGREVFTGVVDVLVCGGFAGNIFLKTAEGISNFILEYLFDAFHPTMTEEVKDILHHLNLKVNYAEYPGAIVCGVEGVVVKCHGFSSARAMSNGIQGARRLVERGLIPELKKALHQ